jgi:hypothetical protein
MFFILTMLVLAQFWNLLAGYGGLVSHRPAGFRRHRRLCNVRRCDPRGSIRSRPSSWGASWPLIAGHSHRVLCLPPARRLFRHRHLGHRRGGPPSGGAVAGSRRRHGHVAAPFGYWRHVARRNADRGDVRRAQLCRARHPRLLAGGTLAVGTIAGIYWLLRTKRGWAWRPCATISKPRNPSVSMQSA